MSGAHPRPAQSLARIFLWPVVLALLSLLGLVAALTGDGWLDAVSWASLGALVLVCATAYWRR